MTAIDPAQNNIADATDDTFINEVVEASNDQLVLVDFWAPWCGPCKSLTPVLERAVNAENGKVKLVKVNIDENPGYAGQMGVRSIPAVFAFDKGRPVNGFQGALPEGQIKQFIAQLLSGTDSGKQLEEMLAQAATAMQAGDIGSAAQMFASILEVEATNANAIAGLARCYLANGDRERATQILDMADEDAQNDAAIKSVRTALSLMAENPLDEDMADASGAVDSEPEDHDARFELAQRLLGQGKNKEASDHLLTILSDDLEWGEGKAKAKLLEIFEAAGPKDPVTIEGRRRLGSLMFA